MENKERFIIFSIIAIYLIVLNIVIYIPFSIYNSNLNVSNWDKESKTFYCYLMGIINIIIVFLTPAIYNDFKKVKNANYD